MLNIVIGNIFLGEIKNDTTGKDTTGGCTNEFRITIRRTYKKNLW
jgi:hypothetical protein